MLSATIFLLYRYQTSTKELIVFIIYKFAVLIIFILLNNHTLYYIDFVFEFGFLFFWIISLVIYKQLREDYLIKSVEFFTEQKYENQYYQGLINMINKSFLSLNITNYSLTFNNPFENFLKILGLTEEEIEIKLKEKNKFVIFGNNFNSNFINNNKNNNNNNNNNNKNNNSNNNNNFNSNIINHNNNNNNNFQGQIISQNIINKSNNNLNNTTNLSNINLNVNDVYSNNNVLITAQGQRLEMTTQNNISNNNNFNTVQNLNNNRLLSSDNNLDNIMNSNAFTPLNNVRNLNNQISYNKLNSNSINNSFINQANNFNNFSNLNLNSFNNNNNINNLNNFNNNENLKSFNRINLGINRNNPNINNFDTNNIVLDSNGVKSSNINSIGNKNNKDINFGNNFTFLNQANNNLRNYLNPKTTDRVFINNTNTPLNNNNINNNNIVNNNQNLNMGFNADQKLFPQTNLINDNLNPNNFENKNINFNNKRENDEDSFINKLDFMLNVFINFYEEPNINFNTNEINLNNNQIPSQQRNIKNVNNKDNNNINQVSRNMSEAIREIFYSRFKIDLNEGFIFKGIYSTLPAFPVQMTIELYYRKILTYRGEIVEFYYNDISTTRLVETEKVLNKIRSLVLAKISYEFKVPLITIIYILKNYRNSNNFKSDNASNNYNLENNKQSNKNNSFVAKSNNSKNNISAEDFIRNTIDLGDYMLSLINDIIDYSIINSEFDFKCEFENFEFSEMMEFSFRILKILLACKGLGESVVAVLEIDSRIPKFFCNDEKRIKQILLNLITNSIKFTKKGYIKLSAYLLDEGLIKVSVEDTGCGIQQEILQRIFNDIYTPTVNLDGNFQKSTSGLGLSISKKIIEKIGNKIECSSIVNQKTIFSFVISSKAELLEINFEKNDNISYIDNNIINNRPGFTTSYVPINNGNNDNFKNFNNNNFNNNFGNINNPNNNDKFDFNSIRRDNKLNNFLIKTTNLSERNNISQFDRMKAAMNINNRRQASPASKKNTKSRSNSNSEIYFFGGNIINNPNNYNKNTNNNERDFNNNLNQNFNSNDKQEFRPTGDYEEEPTILQSPKDIPTDIGEITQNNRSIVYNTKKEFIKNENYELKVYIKPILKYFESTKNNIILFVDDNEIIRKSVKKQILSYAGLINDVDVVCCKDGAEAFYLLFIDQISNNKIKMIVSDDKMVLVNGEDLYEMIEKYAEIGKLKRILFVLSENQSSKEDENMKKINEYYYLIRKNLNKEIISKILEIAKLK
jgi:signal transduction histidine kinase